MTHLHDDQLTQHAGGALDELLTAEVELHLSVCEQCRARFDEVSALVLGQTVAPSGPVSGAHHTRPDGPIARQETTNQLVLHQGTKLGRYVLLERLGTGGMGEVFTAYDPHLGRKVALKLLRPGSLSKAEGRTRLLREAQAMARLSHPNVIAVHDVGTFEDRVFIAMEFVEGETLGTWLRGNQRWQDVLSVMLGAGAGLAAAHRAGIVHRDFKPDNVLIGDDLRARVVDFGLARQAGSSGAGGPASNETATVSPGASSPGAAPTTDADSSADFLSSPLTRDGAVMGTPGYMAPEQLSGLPADARSDQFSFCVALYEGLYGKRPFGGSTLKAHADEIATGNVPPPPSGSLVPEGIFAALQRGLAADPLKRFDSMESLLDALKPTRAGPRKRFFMTVAVLATVASAATAVAVYSSQQLKVCGGANKRLTGTWDGAVRARLNAAFLATGAPFAADAWRSVDNTLDGYTQSWVSAQTDACEAAHIRKTDTEELYERKRLCLENRLKQVKALTFVLETADREVVANAAAAARRLDRIDDCRDVAALNAQKETPPEQRQAEEAIRTKLLEARTLHDAGKYKKGAEVAAQAVQLPGPPAALAEGWLLLGRLQIRAGDAKAAEASFFEAAVQAERAGDPKLVARGYSRLAGVVGGLAQRFDEAHAWEKLARAAATRVSDDREVEAELASNAGQVLLAEGAPDRALVELEHALAVQEALYGLSHPEVARTLNNQATALAKLQRFGEASKAYERSLELHLSSQGADHPDTASSMHNLAVIYRREGRLADSLNMFERSLNVRLATLGPEHPDVALSYLSLGNLEVRLGAPDKALEHLQRALDIRVQSLGPDSPAVAAAHEDLAALYLSQHAWKEALAHAQAALTINEKSLGPKAAATMGSRELTGVTLTHLGQWEQASKQLQRTLDDRRERYGDEHPDVARAYHAFGELYLAQNKPDRALPMFDKALAIREKTQGHKHAAVAAELYGIGRCELLLKAPDKAVAALERADDIQDTGDEGAERALLRFELAKALWELSPDERRRAVELATAARASLIGDANSQAATWLNAHQLSQH